MQVKFFLWREFYKSVQVKIIARFFGIWNIDIIFDALPISSDLLNFSSFVLLFFIFEFLNQILAKFNFNQCFIVVLFEWIRKLIGYHLLVVIRIALQLCAPRRCWEKRVHRWVGRRRWNRVVDVCEWLFWGLVQRTLSLQLLNILAHLYLN